MDDRTHPLMSHQQIADMLGVSDECIRRTEMRALKKVRQALADAGVMSLNDAIEMEDGRDPLMPTPIQDDSW